MAKPRPHRYSGVISRAPSAPSAPSVRRGATIRSPRSVIKPLDKLMPRDRITPGPSSGGGGGGGPAPVSAAPDPRDATYWAQRSKLLSQHTTDLAKIEQAQAYEDTDFTEAVRRRALQGDKDRQSIREGANREGLLFSGQLGKRQGDYDVAFTQREGDARNVYERAKAERAPVLQALREALAAGVPLDDAALYAEAVDRALQRDMSADGPLGIPLPGEEEHGGELALVGPPRRAPAPRRRAKPKPKPKAKSKRKRR